MKSISLFDARILVICQNAHDQEYLEDFFERIEGLPKPDFISGTVKRIADKYAFIVFSGHLLGELRSEEAVARLPEEAQYHLSLLDYCLQNTPKYIVYFGKFYFNLNQERCPSANSKFTLFARIKELIDFINHYKSE